MTNDNRFQITLYMNEFHISYRHPNWNVVEIKLQESKSVVVKLTKINGFKFSTSKTYMLHFTKLPIPTLIELRLGNIRIKKSETVKYLDLVFESKLTYNS